MKITTEKQILEWKEELSRQIKTRDHAKKVYEEAITNINALQGGIQFGELLLKSIESKAQPSDTTASKQPEETGSSKSKA